MKMGSKSSLTKHPVLFNKPKRCLKNSPSVSFGSNIVQWGIRHDTQWCIPIISTLCSNTREKRINWSIT